MTSICDLPIEDLVAYLDGELRGGRKELAEAHLQACPVCRQRRTVRGGRPAASREQPAHG
jgi:anti-sigma factor RsiW